MVEKKNVQKEKKTVQIKATTGAWWKSTTASDVSADKPEMAPPVPKPSKPIKQTKRPIPRKRSVKKPAEPVSTEKEVSEVIVGGAQESQEITAPRKTSAKQPAAKNKEPGEVIQADEPQSLSGIGSDEPVVDQLPVEDKENIQKPSRPAKSTRGRRGKRTGRKPGSEEKVLPGEEGETVPEDMEEKVDEDSVKKQQVIVEEKADVAKPEEEVKKLCKLLINAEEPEECRLALLEDGRLESIHVSTVSKNEKKNNIYKARIVAVEPSLQAAFIDYGTEKNGFLPFSEIHPEYYKQELSDNVRQQVEAQQWKKLSITDVVEKGQEILAQVVKEEVGKKGANMTTFLSIPGRCVVLMPGSDSSGISRKISGEKRRSQLREIMQSIELPEGIGWIVRTASVDITQETLSRDVEYLLELWGDIKKKGQEMDGVGLVYEDQKSVLRFLREHFDPSIEEILVDDRIALDEVKAFVKMLPANQRTVKVRLHQGARPIFNQYSIEDQIESIYQPQVNLPSGGSIVIDPTEALVAIDVNSGSTSKGKNFEASIFQANMEAATELARQLRLRDLGGLIVVDFIDMRSRKNILAVEKQVKAAMKRDKAKVDFSRISKFGLMEISRQKLGAPIETGNYRRCEHCMGRGTVRSVETLSLYYLRRIQTGASRKPVGRIECHFPLEVASYLLNNKRSEVNEMEKRCQVEITIIAETEMKPADNEIIFHKAEKEANSKKQA